jgi:hypothetical protein
MNLLVIGRFGVYHWKQFIFEDGSVRDKYWIALNCTINQKEYHAILPTSKIVKHKFNTIDTFVIEANKSQYFKVSTLLDFKNIQINSKEEIETAFHKGNFDYLGLLEKEIQSEINKVIANSITLSEILINTLLCRKT